MRCLSCNNRLNNRESTRKYASSGTFVDLCDRCFSTVSADIPDLEGVEQVPEDTEDTTMIDLDMDIEDLFPNQFDGTENNDY